MRYAAIAAIICLCACGSDKTGSTAPSTTVDLSGNWKGTIASGPSDPSPGGLTWTVSQSGSSLTGPLVATITDQGVNHSFSGTMTGTVSGSSVALSASFPAGAFTALGGPSTCSMTGSSNGTLSGNNKITGTLNVVWGASCVGTVAEKATETNILTLSKQ